MPKKPMHVRPAATQTKPAGTRAAETTVINTDPRAQEAEIRRLRLERLERELLGPWPDVPRKRRPNISFHRKIDQ